MSFERCTLKLNEMFGEEENKTALSLGNWHSSLVRITQRLTQADLNEKS